MAKRPAARESESTNHGGTLEPGEGIATVRINGRPAWPVRNTHKCPKDGPESVVSGSSSVNIGGRPAAREGDFLIGSGAPNRIESGSESVNIGSPAAGIAGAANAASFCAGYCALKRDWKDLSFDERRKRYAEVVGKLFATFDAPPPTISEDAAPGTMGSFDGTTWTLALPYGAFFKDHPPDGEATFHEVRHGEQNFAAARELTTPRPGEPAPDLDDVAEDTGLPLGVVWLAALQPVDRNSADGRFARVMAAELFTSPGKAALKQSIAAYFTTRETGDQAAASRAYQEGYMKRPVGQDAADIEALGDCGGCK